MSGISILLLVVFIIISVLIVGLVLLQNEEGDSLGGLFAGGSNSAFGSRSGNILTKTTYTFITLFFVLSFLLAWLNKSPGDSGLKKDAQLEQAETAVEWWKDGDEAAKNEATPAETSTEIKNADETSSEAAPVEDSEPAQDAASTETVKESENAPKEAEAAESTANN